MIYVPELKGFIVDVPNITFIRCDKEVFYYDNVSTSNITPAENRLTINGGQGSFSLASIKTDSTLDITFASADFGIDMFSMASGENIVTKERAIVESGRFNVTANTLTIPHVVHVDKIKIRGLKNAGETGEGVLEPGTFTAKASESPNLETVVTFADGAVTPGTDVVVTYHRNIKENQTVQVKTDGVGAKGSIWAEYPIYSGGSGCENAAILGKLLIHIFMVQATQNPGIDSSYKTAATPTITFSALDPKRADKQMYEICVLPYGADGTEEISDNATTEGIDLSD